ncbi:MAG TPA: fibronectin type III domain-containing protein [Mycobacteriales bacterium]|jgi:hypothetical protein
MYVSKTLRRLAVVATTASLLSTVPFAPASAAANGSVSPSPVAKANTEDVVVTLTTDHAYAGTPTIKVTRHADSSDTIAVESVQQASPGDVDTFTAKFKTDGANPGFYDIAVEGAAVPNGAETPPIGDVCSSCFEVLAFAPDITSVTPSQVGGNGQLAVTVTGSGFTTKTEYCSLSCAGQPTLTITPSTGIQIDRTDPDSGETLPATTPTAIVRRVRVAANATPGTRTLTVTNTDGQTDSMPFVVGPTVALTAANPPTLGKGATGKTVTLVGSNFAPNAIINIKGTGAPAPVTGVVANGVTYASKTWVSATEFTLNGVSVADAESTPAGTRLIEIRNPDGSYAQSTTIFSVTNKPSISSVVETDSVGDDKYGQGAKNVVLTVNGADFQPNATLAIADPAGITVNSYTVDAADKITANLTLVQSGTGAPSLAGHAVTVTNPDYGTTTFANGLTVSAGPTVTGVTPPSRGRGETVDLTITGTNFDKPNGVEVVIPNVTIDPSKITVNDATSITVDDAVVSNALNVGGVKSVTVTNKGDRGSYTCASCFSIDNLQTNSVSPSSVLNNGTKTLTIGGSGFATDATVKLIKDGFGSGEVPDISGTNVVVNQTGTSLTADFAAAGIAPGDYLVRVTNGTSNPGVGTCTCKLNVVASAPTVTSVAPSSVGAGADDKTIVITGTNFLPGADVLFSNSGVTVVGNPVVTPTKITAVIDVASDAAEPPAVQDASVVTVRNTDGQTDDADFDVTPAPAPTSLSPASRGQGTTTTVTLSGDDFADGATITVSGTGVTVGSATFADGGPLPTAKDTLTATLTVANDAATGARTLTVHNPDGGQGSCSCLTVNAKPTITSVTPAKGARETAPSVTIAGSGFAADAVVNAGAGITTAVTNTTAQALTVTFTIAADAARTTRDVIVTNTDGGTATLPAAFKVYSVPDKPTGVSASRGDGTVTVSWTAPAYDGNDALTEYTVTSNPASTPVTVSASQTNATFTGLTNGTAYTFTVVAKNAAGASPASDASAPVTAASAPGAPTGVTASPGEGKATVSWTAPAADNGSAITGYTITASPGGATESVNGTTLTKEFGGLTNGTAYKFTVKATNAVGTSPASAESAPVTPFTVPDAPTGVTGTPADGAVNVSWTAPSFNGGSAITGYTVTASPGNATKSVDGTATTAMVTGLTNGTAYTFTVKATNDRGASAASAPSAAITPYTVPGAPTTVQGTPGDGQVTVTWEAPASTGGSPITEYVVTATPGGTQKKTADGSTLNLVFDGLTNGTAYTFTVGATNAAGTTTSAPSGAVTPRTVPGAPTAVSAVRGDQSATVSWTAPVSDGGSPVTGYVVTSTPGGKTASAAANATSAVVSGLTNGTSYTFTVVATNAAGNGAASDATNAVTPAGVPAAPTNVVATAGHAAASVSWTAANANGSPVTSYTVTSTPGGIVKTVTTGTSTTFSGLTNGTSYTFAVTATNAVGTGTAGTSNAVVPTAITGIGLSATSSVLAGNYATLRGTLVKSPGTVLANQPVRIYAKVAPATSYQWVRTLTTDANGFYSTSFRMARNTTWRAVFPGANGLDPSQSALRFTSVAYKVTAYYGLSGRTVTVTGVVSPNAGGRRVYLRYRRSDGALITVAYATIASNGSYKIVKTLAPGTYALFAFVTSSATNAEGKTSYRSTTIR